MSEIYIVKLWCAGERWNSGEQWECGIFSDLSAAEESLQESLEERRRYYSEKQDEMGGFRFVIHRLKLVGKKYEEDWNSHDRR